MFVSVVEHAVITERQRQNKRLTTLDAKRAEELFHKRKQQEEVHLSLSALSSMSTTFGLGSINSQLRHDRLYECAMKYVGSSDGSFAVAQRGVLNDTRQMLISQRFKY